MSRPVQAPLKPATDAVLQKMAHAYAEMVELHGDDRPNVEHLIEFGRIVTRCVLEATGVDVEAAEATKH